MVATTYPQARVLSDVRLRDLVLIVLAASTGAVDAISWLGLRKVFSAFMTGNLAFLGFRAGGAAGPSAGRVLCALAAFSVGALLCGLIVRRVRDTRPLWSPRVTLALAVSVVLEAVFLAVWTSVGGHPSTAAGDVLIGISSLAMGVQSAAIFSLGLRAIFTTAVTATVTVFFGDLAGWAQARGERYRLLEVALAVLAGAAGGALLFDHAPRWAPALPLGLTAFAVATAAAAFATPAPTPAVRR
jgi:uncharacterized membrane protein YoaK (UPF0700 family)